MHRNHHSSCDHISFFTEYWQYSMPPITRKYHIRSLAITKRGRAENGPGPGHDDDNDTLELIIRFLQLNTMLHAL